MSQMLKSSALMALATLISRLLGLVREMVYARFMGNGWVASAFLLAFQIPNLFRRLLGEGALTAAFIPEFKAKEKLEGEVAMWRSANAVVSGLVVAAALVVGVAILVTTGLLHGGGFSERTRLMLSLLRLMFPYTLLICVAAVCIGMLNARGRFFVPALGSAVLNVVMIASVLWLAPRFGTVLPDQIYGLAWGVLAAGLAQALFQLPSLVREGWRYRWVNPWKDETVRRVVGRMLPTTIGVAAFQLNVMITQGFAFFLGESVVASFQYAVRLMELPQGLFGVSLATYLLPTLSGLAAERRHDEFRANLFQGLSHLMVVNLLASGLLVGLAYPTVRLIFEGGNFRPSATESVTFALGFLAPGLVAFSGTNILARAFYAVGDTRVPMQISVFCLALNVVLSLVFALGLHEGGLALANTLTSVTNVILLAYALRRKMPKTDFRPWLRDLIRVAPVAVVAGVAAFLMSQIWDQAVGGRTVWGRFGAVFLPGALAAAGYFGALLALRVPAARELWDWGTARLNRRGN